jgi:hypothetical protein
MDPNELHGALGIVVGAAAFGAVIAVWIGVAIGNGFIAARLGKSVALWVILTLIPIYNFFFIYYVWFYVVCRVLNRLNQIALRIDAVR